MTTTFTQLTAPGSTDAVDGFGFKDHVFQYTIASIDTSVDVRVEGSLDLSNWTNVDTVDQQQTGNGSFAIVASGFAFSYYRFTFVSEAGGTAATINAKHKGQN